MRTRTTVTAPAAELVELPGPPPSVVLPPTSARSWVLLRRLQLRRTMHRSPPAPMAADAPGVAHRDGTAWLIFDAGGDLFRYQCYWYGGRSGDHVLEHSRARDAEEAVAWGLARTPQVRIRLPDHRTWWAGTVAAPATFAGHWAPERQLVAVGGGTVGAVAHLGAAEVVDVAA